MVLHDIVCRDAAGLLGLITPWLASDLERFMLIAGVAERMQADDDCCLVVMDDERPKLALVQTPPFPLLVAAVDAPSEGLLAHAADIIARRGELVPGLNGPPEWVQALSAHLGRPIRERMGLGLHRLVGEPKLPRPVEGEARTPLVDDIPQLRAWLSSFDHEVQEPKREFSDEQLRAWLADFRFWFVDGEPRSMARICRPLLGGVTVGAVYTPIEQRAKGYAGAVVHALCSDMRRAGKTYVMLYTDLANPTSNGLYRRIGFQHVCDQERVLW